MKVCVYDWVSVSVRYGKGKGVCLEFRVRFSVRFRVRFTFSITLRFS